MARSAASSAASHARAARALGEACFPCASPCRSEPPPTDSRGLTAAQRHERRQLPLHVDALLKGLERRKSQRGPAPPSATAHCATPPSLATAHCATPPASPPPTVETSCREEPSRPPLRPVPVPTAPSPLHRAPPCLRSPSPPTSRPRPAAPPLRTSVLGVTVGDCRPDRQASGASGGARGSSGGAPALPTVNSSDELGRLQDFGRLGGGAASSRGMRGGGGLGGGHRGPTGTDAMLWRLQASASRTAATDGFGWRRMGPPHAHRYSHRDSHRDSHRC